MKKTLKWGLAICLIVGLTSCGDSDDKEDKEKTEKTESAGSEQQTESLVPNIDLESLTTEAAILEAMEQVVNARIEDERRSEEDQDYSGYYVELTNLYADVLEVSTNFADTFEDPQESLDYMNRVNEITDKMYE